MEKILEEMQSVISSQNLAPIEHPIPSEMILDILEGFLELPKAKVLQGLSMPTTLGTNPKSLGLRKQTDLDSNARLRLKIVVKTTV